MLKKATINFVDRTFLIGQKILEKYTLYDGVDMFLCVGRGQSGKCVVLKYSYAGNTQYHKIRYEDLDRYAEGFAEARRIFDAEH